jgi:tetratricopeptide (TPR) repeat protein
MLAVGESRNNNAWVVTSCFAIAMTSIPIGNFSKARKLLERAISLYDPTAREAYAGFIGDPPIIMRMYLAYTLTWLNRIEEGQRIFAEAIEDARRLGQMWALSCALWLKAFCAYTLASYDEALSLMAEARSLRKDYGFRHFEAQATLGQGWCMAALGNCSEGLALARDGLNIVRGTGNGLMVPTFILNEAVILGRVGELSEGLCRVEAALQIARRTGARWDMAEMYRVRGELLWSSGWNAAAIRSFERAIRIARTTKAPLFEERARLALSEKTRAPRVDKSIDAGLIN